MMWRKSSYSNLCDCVEVGADWARSSRCADGQCLEVRRPSEVAVHIRDSADRDGPVLRVPAAAWRRFVAGLR